MDEDLAYNIAKALYDNVAELKEINKTAEQIDETKPRNFNTLTSGHKNTLTRDSFVRYPRM